MTDTRKWWWMAIALIAGGMVYLLSPILMPFVVAALLAYLANPLVERLVALKVPRTPAVAMVFSVLILVLLMTPVIVFPMLERQVAILVRNWPHYIDWLQGNLIPWVQARFGGEIEGLDLDVNLDEVKGAVMEHWRQAGGVVAGLLSAVTKSWLVLLGWLFNLILIPVVTFYLLRDWDSLLARLKVLLPRSIEPTVVGLARECNQVLATFLRGQLLVMLSLGVIYSAGLWVAGLDLAILLGMTAGLVSFVPYLGLIVGFLLSGVAGVVQFGDAGILLSVAIVFGIGQLLETLLLTPLLVGERVGLHPVAVIFAVLAGGQLFGAVGVLLALPVAAVMVVLLRYIYQRYRDSDLYGDARDGEATPPPRGDKDA